MAKPTSRETLKEYCLRALGAPVLEINVDEDQLEDRIDEALDIFRLYHYDGIEKVYLKHQITASTLTIQGSNAMDFHGKILTGATSGASGELFPTTDPHVIQIARITGTFVAGEVVSDGTVSATLAATNFFVPGDIENKYIPASDLVYGIIRVLPLYQATSSSKNLFDLQYQLRLNDIYNLTSTSLIYYTTVMQHMTTLDLLLNGKPICRYNRLQNKIFLDIDWMSTYKMDVGAYVIVEAYRALDPDEYTKMWSEPWLKHYVTALFKRQWGVNLTKFQGLQLPGGVTLDGKTMYDEATTEIKDLEDDIMNKSAPLEWTTG